MFSAKQIILGSHIQNELRFVSIGVNEVHSVRDNNTREINLTVSVKNHYDAPKTQHLHNRRSNEKLQEASDRHNLQAAHLIDPTAMAFKAHHGI